MQNVYSHRGAAVMRSAAQTRNIVLYPEEAAGVLVLLPALEHAVITFFF